MDWVVITRVKTCTGNKLSLVFKEAKVETNVNVKIKCGKILRSTMNAIFLWISTNNITETEILYKIFNELEIQSVIMH